MNKLPKYIVSGLLLLIGVYVVFFIVLHAVCSYSTDYTECERHRRLFKKENIKEVDPLCVSNYDSNELNSHFIFKNEYYIDIWEFKMLDIDPKNVTFSYGKDLIGVNFWAGEVIGIDSDKETNVKYGYNFDDGMQVILDNFGKIERNIDGSHYKGFYGIVNRVCLSNGNGKPQILLDYISTKEPIVFLVYKEKSSFFVITINTNKIEFDESILDILNLE